MSHYLRTTQDRSITTVSGGLNERFGRIEKPALVVKTTPPPPRATPNTSVFSRIGRPGAPSTSKSLPSGIQSRLGRISNGGMQKGRVNTRLTPAVIKRGKQPIQPKGKHVQQNKGRIASKPRGGGDKKPVSGRAKGGKKPVSADDLDKALDTYMMKDPKSAQAKLNDELDSYMDEAGDVLMGL